MVLKMQDQFKQHQFYVGFGVELPFKNYANFWMRYFNMHNHQNNVINQKIGKLNQSTFDGIGKTLREHGYKKKTPTSNSTPYLEIRQLNFYFSTQRESLTNHGIMEWSSWAMIKSLHISISQRDSYTTLMGRIQIIASKSWCN